jgi:hypothetical protein
MTDIKQQHFKEDKWKKINERLASKNVVIRR